MSNLDEGIVLDAVFEKSDTIFFAVKPDGVMLHNYADSAFMDLDGHEELLWKYCDGTIPLTEALSLAAKGKNGSPSSHNEEHLCNLAKRLVEGRFLRERG
jgi:hypothetical protein